LIFADTWPGKYTNLDEALELVRVGGLYVVDDMLPQPNWPEDHPPKVARLLETLGSRPDFSVTTMSWSTALVIAARMR
jgi:predicted O-methyltransferase YrrM